MQGINALDADNARSLALDSGPAAVQEIGQVLDFRLPGRVFQNGFPFGQGRGHEQVLGPPHSGEVEGDMRPVQPLAAGVDVSGVDVYDRPHALQGPKMEIHRPGADGASPGQGHLGPAQSGQ